MGYFPDHWFVLWFREELPRQKGKRRLWRRLATSQDRGQLEEQIRSVQRNGDFVILPSNETPYLRKNSNDP